MLPRRTPPRWSYSKALLGSRPEAVCCLLSGAFLVASGLFYALAWAVTGQSLEGPVSIRKPMLFGFSTGVTLLSVGWIVAGWRRRPFDGALFVSFGLALVAEVFLIDLQHARGAPSHFNRSSAFDSAVVDAMALLILFATALIAYVAIRSFVDLEEGFSPDLRIAIQQGTLLLLTGCLLGIVITLIGEAQMAAQEPPEIYGKAGVLKFPHGVPLHAVQALPVAAFVLARAGLSVASRKKAVLILAALFWSATSYAVLQTGFGAPRFSPTAGALAAALVALFIFSLVQADVCRRAFKSLFTGGSLEPPR